MMRKIVAALALCTLSLLLALAQTAGDRIDLYFGDWYSSTPRPSKGLSKSGTFSSAAIRRIQ